MFDLASSEPPATATLPEGWTAERYLEALHPRDGRGVVGGLTIQGDQVRSHTWRREILAGVTSTMTEQEAFVAMNPYFGPRGGGRRLAGLNAFWLDLDIYRVPSLATLPRHEVPERILLAVSEAGLPPPSMLIDSGRGYYCIWLVSGASPAALPRWRAVMRALTAWAKPLGADPACVDPARVLRLPGSWHDGAGRQVTIVSGDGARHPFELLADSIWRAIGRPTRRELDAARSKRRAQTEAGKRPEHGPRGLPRRAFWGGIRHDLEILLAHWGGVVPVGMRDLWLHIYCCALTWTEPDADILDLVLSRAMTVAPGLRSRDVARMMRPTIRRGLAALPRQPRACDPRYDYASDRLCELLSVDRHLATSLGFRQLLPADLRADRNRQRRTERRRAAGAMPRPIWLAAHPISRLKPWEAEGISRATWYRRQADGRQRRLRACIDSMMAGAADVRALGETGAAPLYKGVAQPAAGTELACGVNPMPSPDNSQPSREAREKTTRTAVPRRPAAEPAGVPGAGGANPSPAATTTEPTVPDQPALDIDILAAAAGRLSHTELGALTRVALVLARGPAHRRELGRQAHVPPDLIDALDAWLRAAPETGLVIGLVAPGIAPRRARAPRQGQLFDDATATPTPVSSSNPGSLRAATITAGVRVLGRAGVGEQNARSFLGQQLKHFGFGILAEAIDAVEPKLDTIAEPRAWIAAYVQSHAAGAAKPIAGSRSGSRVRGNHSAGTNVAPAPKPRPLATPEFLGISPGLQRQIEEQNRRIQEEAKALFRGGE